MEAGFFRKAFKTAAVAAVSLGGIIAGPAVAAYGSVSSSGTGASGAVSVLNDVSCTAPGYCMAVGDYSPTSGGSTKTLPYAEIWNGGNWKLEPLALPTGFSFGYLDSVSCNSPWFCVAVGYMQTSKGVSKSLTATWTGASWTMSP
ncbi:MAG TPA: hypothetical protein VGS21_04900, partial [Acidimicrobiales bacterium]|nr:hypothetical protein [Acidimicrobiales bacterium]